MALPVKSRAPSIVASQAASPMVKAGKMMWKLMTKPNWIRERTTGSNVIGEGSATAEDAVHDPAEEQVGHYGQQDCHHQGLAHIDPAQLDDLVDAVHDAGQHEDLADVLPAFLDQVDAV